MMKENYENIKLEIIFYDTADVIRMSANDNVEDLPDFPEAWMG